ncbi:DUF4091 domain-containing protein [Parabacteroides sp. 52]|uniref:DUF4091 domain-containing protein n=1 Tax=unclassified Parabacteroides TaxID=2649774 RepID=UPI0013D54F15|nr:MULTISPECIES: DUF4091 domain-containing protein [unclassified Parabacteroides]MDH6535345.1 hypothetical protein [Parabacteroides sp. PM5-20]NDV56027.1 DUF4091 domain-containing protein [Parabacteroides sp. 52]
MKKSLILSAFLTFNMIVVGQTEKFPLGDYTELTDTKPYDSEDVWKKQTLPTQLSWGSTDIRYAKLSIPTVQKATRWQTKAWKGERVNAQAVLWTTTDLTGATLSVSDLKNGSSVIPASTATANFVRYVMTDELSKNGKTGCGHREIKADWDSSLVADGLDIIKIRDIKACSTQPIWLNIWVPQDVKAGKYKGTLTVSGANFTSMDLSFEVEVLNRSLPAPKDWKFHLDLWQNPYAVARYYQVPLWSRAHLDAMLPVMKILANAGQKVITASIMHKPWAGQTEDHFDSMVGKIKKIDGSWAYDYTVFDKWIEFMMDEVGIDQQINCFTMIPWALSFDYIDQATNRVLYVETKPGDALYAEYWGTFLKDFAQHLKQKGWFEKTTISMDERGPEAMKEAIKVIREADKDFKISTQGHFYPEIEPEIYDLCLAYGHNFPEEVKEAREKAGKKSTVYTCCSEPLPNVFTFSPPAEGSWTFWHAMAGNYDGYLRWAYNSWTIDPLRDSRFRTWAAGDCYLVYPGARSSIRMERMIEGLQDCEKIRLLREEFTAKNQKNKLQKLNNTVAKFVPENLTKENAGEMINEGRKILNAF